MRRSGESRHGRERLVLRLGAVSLLLLSSGLRLLHRTHLLLLLFSRHLLLLLLLLLLLRRG